MAQLIVERNFDRPLEDADIKAMVERLVPCLKQYGARWMRSYLSADRKRTICAFEAADAESIRLAHRQAEVQMDRIWPAQLIVQNQDVMPAA